MSQNEITMPKNVRQIGEKEENCRILIEDYVITYLNQIATGVREESAVAALYGHAGEQEGIPVFRVYAAVAGQGRESCRDLIGQVAENLRKEYIEYFPELEFLGWGIVAGENALPESQGIYAAEFASVLGTPRILYRIEPGEYLEKSFYFISGKAVGLNGFWIYYEKNEGMQNYLIKWNEKRNTVQEPVRDISMTLRSNMQEKKVVRRQFGFSTAIYAASLLTLTLSFGIGVVSMSRYEKMQELEGKLGEVVALLEGESNPVDLPVAPVNSDNVLTTLTPIDHEDTTAPLNNTAVLSESDMSKESDDFTEVFSDDNPPEIVKNIWEEKEDSVSSFISDNDMQTQPSQEGDAPSGEKSNGVPQEGDAPSGEQPNNAPQEGDAPSGEQSNGVPQEGDAPSGEQPKDDSLTKKDEVKTEADVNPKVSQSEYRILPGDTLSGISYRNYGTVLMVKEICRLNGISDEDNIIIGQKIVLP